MNQGDGLQLGPWRIVMLAVREGPEFRPAICTRLVDQQAAKYAKQRTGALR